jgi:hypothetical protein
VQKKRIGKQKENIAEDESLKILYIYFKK